MRKLIVVLVLVVAVGFICDLSFARDKSRSQKIDTMSDGEPSPIGGDIDSISSRRSLEDLNKDMTGDFGIKMGNREPRKKTDTGFSIYGDTKQPSFIKTPDEMSDQNKYTE
ncbi:MAG: hypothetical protein P9M13_01320 [Candidatus Ancaeobacter aquaticus]|nr:hypothetical protein [Candidatus Ancaeobacter aquaticus]